MRRSGIADRHRPVPATPLRAFPDRGHLAPSPTRTLVLRTLIAVALKLRENWWTQRGSFRSHLMRCYEAVDRRTEMEVASLEGKIDSSHCALRSMVDNLKAKRDKLLGGLGVKLAGVDDLVSKYAGNVTEQSRVLGGRSLPSTRTSTSVRRAARPRPRPRPRPSSKPAESERGGEGRPCS